jgi:lipoprotein-releasing system ATP-binding protein
MSSHFALTNIHQSFKQGTKVLPVLQGAVLEIGQGEVVALVGPSGSGKSSLLHIAGLMEKPEQGSLTLKGQVVTDADDKARTALRRAHIGFVYQFHNLLPEFTALENVAMPARLAGDSKAQALAKASALIEKLGLADRASHLPSQLSGGEQQRVAIARALTNRPALVLADEPTGSLDGAAGDKVADLLLSEARAQGSSVLLATHDMDLAARADRIVRLRDGLITTV